MEAIQDNYALRVLPLPGKFSEKKPVVFVDNLIQQKRLAISGQLESLQLSVHMFNMRTARAA